MGLAGNEICGSRRANAKVRIPQGQADKSPVLLEKQRHLLKIDQREHGRLFRFR